MFGTKKKSDKSDRSGDVTERVVSTVISPYAPRQSGRVNNANISADNDTWVEHYAVVELEERPQRFSKSSSSTTARKYVIRSFFQSRSTGRREWDEPPSGASDIQFATGEMRRMAEAQLVELDQQRSVAPQHHAAAAVSEKSEKPEKSKKKLWKMNRRRSSSTSNNKGETQIEEQQQALETSRRDRNVQRSELAEQEFNRQVQLALAMSLEQGRGKTGDMSSSMCHGGSTTSSFTSSGYEDEMMMAKALSLSEQDAAACSTIRKSAPHENDDEEDELLRQAIERSKVEISSFPQFHLGSSRLLGNGAAINPVSFESSVEVGIDDQKMNMNEMNSFVTPEKQQSQNTRESHLRSFDPFHKEEGAAASQGNFDAPVSPVKPPEPYQTPSLPSNKEEQQNQFSSYGGGAFSVNLLDVSSPVFDAHHDQTITSDNSLVHQSGHRGKRWSLVNKRPASVQMGVSGTGTDMIGRRECAELI